MKYIEEIKPLFRQFFGGGVNVPLLRTIIGALGVALPIILIVWGFLQYGTFQDSLSDYYSLRTRDAFVGILFVIGWFLFAYKGYEKIDSIAGKLACIFAMGVALFPNSADGWQRTVHLSCAAALFFLLGVFSLFLFTKTKGSPKGLKRTFTSAFHPISDKQRKSITHEKKIRNVIYRVCGIVIWLCLVLIVVNNFFLQDTVIKNINPVFWLESIMIWAFGFSWFIKGETVFKDKTA